MSFAVTLSPSGNTFTVDEETPILSAGLAAGYYLPYSCRQGHCANCKGRVLAGVIDHRASSPAYLSLDQRAAGEALLCQATARSDLVIAVDEIEGLDGLAPRIVPCRAVEIARVAPDVAVMRVRLPMNENMLFAPGQFVEFILADGARRRYSIAVPCTAEGASELEFHLRHMPGGRFTDHVFATMRPREVLRFEGPLGTFFLRKGEKPIILCATGTGFAPIKAMLLHAFATGVNRTRDIRFYWGGRTLADLYMLDLVRGWAAEQPGFSFQPVLSGVGDRPGEDAARRGYISAAVLDDFADLSGHEVYACGSPAMIGALRNEVTTRRGLPPEAFYSDEFLPAIGGPVATEPAEPVLLES